MNNNNPADDINVIKDAKGKRPAFYATEGIDQLMSMVMVLAGEICTLRDRTDAIERVAKDKGIDLAAEIDTLEFDEQALQEREQRRQNFLERLFYLSRKEASEAASGQSSDQFSKVIDDIAKQ